ncbi:MAG: gp53-like domain-containing protein [Methylocystis sp.]|uniref:gp53-like domain-containing protein n=1 Tax=Methylocystis sp. TaxID=1911079 RepID=UPI003DA66A3A
MALAKFFRFPFATSGDKAVIPDATQPAGTVSYEEGFGPDYELDPGVDPAAKDVPRDETNQLYFDITTALREYQTFGVPDYIEASQNGGVAFEYAKFARVRWTDGKVYVSKVDNNADDPTVAASWQVLNENVDFVAINTTAFNGSVVDGEAVYWTGTEFDEAVADGTTAQNVIGFADVTNGRVFVYGVYAGQLSALTPNVEYFLSTATPGAITSVRPAANAVSVGVARTATGLHVNPRLAIPVASETVAGIAENATQAEVNAGLDDVRYVTPLKLRSGFAISLTENGYIKFPAWLGGLIIQWALAASDTTLAAQGGASQTITFPLAFPTAAFAAIPGTRSTSGSRFYVAYSTLTTTSVTVLLVNPTPVGGGSGTGRGAIIAIGH